MSSLSFSPQMSLRNERWCEREFGEVEDDNLGEDDNLEPWYAQDAVDQAIWDMVEGLPPALELV